MFSLISLIRLLSTETDLKHGSSTTFWYGSLEGDLLYLGSHITALGTQLVDLRLCDVSSLLSLVQLMLQLTELAQMSVGLLLLQH